MLHFSDWQNEFRPWIDVKPVKAIKAKAQYKPPEEKMTHETSYSAQFKGETSKPAPADNKFLERRRIRTLYSEPYKEPPKVEKPSVKPSKPKKTTTSHKPLKKAKDKQIASGRAAKKKSAETSNTAKPEDKEKTERPCGECPARRLLLHLARVHAAAEQGADTRLLRELEGGEML
ncbi:Microtubule-associated protein 6 [Aix galericulata]|nr:Microtubule-associated protein 6 [Aix galericulata]